LLDSSDTPTQGHVHRLLAGRQREAGQQTADRAGVQPQGQATARLQRVTSFTNGDKRVTVAVSADPGPKAKRDRPIVRKLGPKSLAQITIDSWHHRPETPSDGQATPDLLLHGRGFGPYEIGLPYGRQRGVQLRLGPQPPFLWQIGFIVRVKHPPNLAQPMADGQPLRIRGMGGEHQFHVQAVENLAERRASMPAAQLCDRIGNGTAAGFAGMVLAALPKQTQALSIFGEVHQVQLDCREPDCRPKLNGTASTQLPCHLGVGVLVPGRMGGFKDPHQPLGHRPAVLLLDDFAQTCVEPVDVSLRVENKLHSNGPFGVRAHFVISVG
jgi:hypothetical protein